MEMNNFYVQENKLYFKGIFLLGKLVWVSSIFLPIVIF